MYKSANDIKFIDTQPYVEVKFKCVFSVTSPLFQHKSIVKVPHYASRFATMQIFNLLLLFWKILNHQYFLWKFHTKISGHFLPWLWKENEKLWIIARSGAVFLPFNHWNVCAWGELSKVRSPRWNTIDQRHLSELSRTTVLHWGRRVVVYGGAIHGEFYDSVRS